MQQHPDTFQAALPLTPPYRVFVDPTHLTEVRKGGQQIGIYTLTATRKKRGVLLPIDTWYALERHRNLINVSIDLANGTISSANLVDTFIYPQPIKQESQQEEEEEEYIQDLNTLYYNHASSQNSVNKSKEKNATSRRYKPYTIPSQPPPPYNFHANQQQKQEQDDQHDWQLQESTRKVPGKQQQQEEEQQQQQQQQTFETFPVLEFFSDGTFFEASKLSSTFGEQQFPSTMEEKLPPSYDNAYSPVYLC